MLDAVDTDLPAPSRVYDWYIGGSVNYAVDREFGARMLKVLPMVKSCARANRVFLQRVVTYLSQQGVKQFLDIGSGVPSVGNSHETARAVNPDARTIYVDYESVAAAHADVLLDQSDPNREQSAALLADFRDPCSILGNAETRRLIDFSQPVAVLGIALMPFIGRDDHPERLLKQFASALAPGSALAMSQITDEDVPEHMIPQMQQFAASYANTQQRVFLRTHQEFEQLFEGSGFHLENPGIVWAPQWHPEIPSAAHDHFLTLDVAAGRAAAEGNGVAYHSVVEHPAEAVFMAGLGRK